MLSDLRRQAFRLKNAGQAHRNFAIAALLNEHTRFCILTAVCLKRDVKAEFQFLAIRR